MVVLASSQAVKDHFKANDRISKFDNPDKQVHTVSWNSDGRRLAFGGVEKTVGVASLDPTKGLRTEFTCKGHSDQVDQVAWHVTADHLLASASGDKSARIWDVRSKKGISTITTKGQNLNCKWSPDGETIALGDKDDRISLVDTKTWKVRHEEAFRTEVNEFAWTPCGRFFFILGGAGQVHVFRAATMVKELTIQAHPSQASCTSIGMGANGRHFAVGGSDALVSVWDLPSLTCLRTIDRLDWPVRSVALSHDGAVLAAGSEDHAIELAHVQSGERVAELRTEGETFALAWHPALHLLAFSSDDPSASSSRSRDSSGIIRLFGLPAR